MTFSLSSHLHRSRRSLENFFIRPIGSIFTPQHFAAMNAAIPSTAESFLLFYCTDYYTDTPFTTLILHYCNLTHDDDTDRHFVCFSIDTMIFSSVFLRISMQDIFQTVIILTFFEIQIETGIYENRLVTSDICIKIKVNHPSELEHN